MIFIGEIIHDYGKRFYKRFPLEEIIVLEEY
jgi:hypothetical protein